MKTVKFIIDGKEIEAQVNEENLKLFEIENGIIEEVEDFYYFNSSFSPVKDDKHKYYTIERQYSSGNYFLTEKECEDAARVVSLWLRMKRFADEHNKENIKFTDDYREKYFIIYDFVNEVLRIDWKYGWQDMFSIYFDNEETAKKAIDTFHDELMWYFTEYEKR